MASICAFCCDMTVAISAEWRSLPTVMAAKISDREGSPPVGWGGRVGVGIALGGSASTRLGPGVPQSVRVRSDLWDGGEPM